MEANTYVYLLFPVFFVGIKQSISRRILHTLTATTSAAAISTTTLTKKIGAYNPNIKLHMAPVLNMEMSVNAQYILFICMHIPVNKAESSYVYKNKY